MRKTILIPLLLLVALDILFVFLNNQYLITAQVAETAISGNYSERHIRQWSNLNDFFTSFKYINSLLKIPLNILLLSVLLLGVLRLFNTALSFAEAMRMSLLAYYVFLLPGFATFFWFAVFNPSFTYAELGLFQPFNLQTYFAGELFGSLERAVYKSFSLVDVLFILLLGYLIYRHTGKSFSFSVALASVPALIVVALSIAYYVL
jgi:hypothetical protein